MSEASFSVFNNVVTDLVSSLMARFPDNAELASVLACHRMAALGNEKTPYRLFLEHVIRPHGDRLRAHDSEFFVERDYSDKESGFPGGASIVAAMKRLWGDMTYDDKQGVYAYIDLLTSVHDNIASAGGA